MKLNSPIKTHKMAGSYRRIRRNQQNLKAPGTYNQPHIQIARPATIIAPLCIINIMEKKTLIQSVLNLLVLLGITTMLFLYTSGYRLSRTEDATLNMERTGMISAKSIPNGANVYLNGVLMTATDATISGIEPGIHTLKITRSGFVTWTKEVEVFPELVTDITAVLVSQSPRLEPLTNTGALYPSMSPSLTKLAFFSKEAENSGVRIISLAQNGLSLFRTTPAAIVKDTPRQIFSSGRNIEWSPDEKNLLVEVDDDIYYLVDLTTGLAETTSSPELIKESWAEKLAEKRADFIRRLDISEEIKTLALSTESLWSPDEKKFLYTNQVGDQLEYRVYNIEKPLPVGEQVETLVFTTNANDPQPYISWYADSYHLILTDKIPNEENRGSISIIRIDGTNKTEIYNSILYADMAYSSPSGDKIIILTSFKSGEQIDLYTVSIR
jgi:hypothetical protein